MQAAGKLQIAPGVEHDFTSDDLQDLGEIGRGAYGAVNKMIFRRTETVMAGKLRLLLAAMRDEAWLVMRIPNASFNASSITSLQ